MDREHTRKLLDVPSYVVAAIDALQFRSSETAALERLADKDWQALLQFADLAHLTLPLLRVCKEVAPEWVSSRIEQNLVDNRQRVVAIKSAYREIAQTLAVANIDHLVLKGFALAPEFIEGEEFRFQSDIDLYCLEQTISQACRALTDLGYFPDRTLDGFPSDHLPIMAKKTKWKWRGNMYDPEMPPSIDLHFCLWNVDETRIAIDGVSKFWDGRSTRKNHGSSFPALNTLDNLGYCALHILRDLFRCDWVIHHVYEMAWFLHHHADDDELWKKWIASHGEDMRSLETISFWLARDWFQCDLSPVLAAEMHKILPLSDAFLKEFSSSPLAGMFSPNKGGMWLHLCLLRTVKDRLAIMKKGLMPTRIPALSAPGQNTTKTRKVRRFWPKQPHIRDVFHVTFRVAFHLRLLIPTLYNGFRLWYCQQQGRKSLNQHAPSSISI